MVVREGHGGPHNMVAIRHVLAKNSQQPHINNNCIILQENDNLVHKVDVSHLTQGPSPPSHLAQQESQVGLLQIRHEANGIS